MLPRSGSKTITVDGNEYQYMVTESGATENSIVPLAVIVQHRENNGARLRVIGLTTRRVPSEQSKFYMGRSVEFSVEPRHVAQLIRLAISRNWQPRLSGPTMILQVSNADLFTA